MLIRMSVITYSIPGEPFAPAQRISHRRSLSDSLVLDDNDKGLVNVSGINLEEYQEVDGTVGAMKNEVIDILKRTEPFNNNGGLSRPDMKSSKSLGNLDRIKAPDELRMDSYNKLFNAKVKRFIKGNPKGKSQEDVRLGMTNVPDTDLKGRRIEVKSENYNRPSLIRPDTDVDVTRPEFSLSSHNNGLPNSQTGLTIPNVGLSSGNMNTPRFKMPDFGLSAHKITTPDTYLSQPKIKREFNSPDITSTDINAHTLDRIKLPSLQKPHLNLEVPSDDIDTSGLSNDFKTADVTIDTPSEKIKIPKFGFSSHLSKGGVDDRDIQVNLPEADLRAPKLNMNSPDIDIDNPTGKMKTPKLKMPKLNFPNFKESNIDLKGDLKRPDLSWSSHNFNADIDVPDTDIDGPKADLKGVTLPNMDLPSGKSKMPKFKMPGFGHSISNSPDMDLSVPKLKGQINSPNLTAPELDVDVPAGKIRGPTIKEPQADIRAPEFNINAPSGKMNLPKSPELDIDVPRGKIKGPALKEPYFDGWEHGFNNDVPSGKLKTPNFKIPNIEGNIGSPDTNLAFPEADVKGPEIDVNSPSLDIDSPAGKFKFPKMKSPKFSMPGFKGPDVDVKGDLKGPDLSMSSPKFETLPDVHLPSGKTKTPKIKLSDFGLSGPKIKSDMDLSVPKMKGPNLTVPKLDVDVPTGNIKGPALKEPNFDFREPEFNINAPSGKLKMPNFKGPNIWSDGSDATFDADITGPDLDIDGREPEFNINAPSGKLKMPAVPELDIGVPTGKIKRPIFVLKTETEPRTLGNMTFPEADIRAPKLDAKSPDIDSVQSNFKLPKFTTPTFDIQNFNEPDIKAKYNLGEPNLNLSAMDSEVGIPDYDTHRPTINTKGLKADITPPDIALPSAKVNFTDTKYTRNRNTSYGSMKVSKDLESLVSSMDLEVPKQALKGSKNKLLSLV
ncbi:neuroblast differentiation-associated protein AHNAK [Tachysurus ichikawai]